jgi:glycosyltransferase involved in cell wall biosynthesis
MKRICHIINVDFGVKIHLRNQLLYLKQNGYDVAAVCSPGAMITQDGPTEDGVTVKLINITSSISPFQDLWSLIFIIKHLSKNKFDIVHTHSLKPGLLGRFAARLARIPVVIHTLHGFYFYEGMSPLAQFFWKKMEKLGMLFGDYTLSQSREDVETAIREGICKPEKIGYLGNGIDLQMFDPAAITAEQRQSKRSELGINDGQKVVAMAGRLIEEKGYKEFFQAARLIRKQDHKVFFWAMGASQPSRNGAILFSDIQADGLDKVVNFLGMRPDMPELLAAADVFVHPSHGREGVPRVLMEASTMEKPIVTTSVRGCREAIIPNKTGLIVPPRDAVSLAESILLLLDNQELADSLGKAARAYALEHFDERSYFARINQTYQMFLS